MWPAPLPLHQTGHQDDGQLVIRHWRWRFHRIIFHSMHKTELHRKPGERKECDAPRRLPTWRWLSSRCRSVARAELSAPSPKSGRRRRCPCETTAERRSLANSSPRIPTYDAQGGTLNVEKLKMVQKSGTVHRVFLYASEDVQGGTITVEKLRVEQKK